MFSVTFCGACIVPYPNVLSHISNIFVTVYVLKLDFVYGQVTKFSWKCLSCFELNSFSALMLLMALKKRYIKEVLMMIT